MRGRRFLVTWCEEDTAEALKAAYQGERDLEFRTRLHGLWLLRSGWRLLSVAAAVGAHYRTVQRWVGWYREGGIGNVLSHKMGGKGQAPFLTDEAQEQVAKEVGAEDALNAARELERKVGEERARTICEAALGVNALRLFLTIFGANKEPDPSSREVVYSPLEIGQLMRVFTRSIEGISSMDKLDDAGLVSYLATARFTSTPGGRRPSTPT